MAVRQLPAPDRRSGKARGAWPHVGLKSLPSTPVVAGIAFASIGVRPVMLSFLGSTVPIKPPVVSHRLVPPTRFNSAFSTKAIRLFGVHERVNLRVSKGIPLDNKAFLDSAVPERPSCIVPAAARHRFGLPPGDKPDGFVAWTARCPKKSFLPGAAGKASSSCEPVHVKMPCECGTCVWIKIFRFGANIQKIQLMSERNFLTLTTRLVMTARLYRNYYNF